MQILETYWHSLVCCTEIESVAPPSAIMKPISISIDAVKPPACVTTDDSGVCVHACFCRSSWCCSHCGNEYNALVIEQRLVEAVQRLSLSYVLQDLQCTRCQGVSVT